MFGLPLSFAAPAALAALALAFLAAAALVDDAGPAAAPRPVAAVTVYSRSDQPAHPEYLYSQ